MIEDFLNQYSRSVQDLLLAARGSLLDAYPELIEEVDTLSRILVYRLAPGNNGVVFTLIPSRSGVKLGFYRGRQLPDPAGLMQGSGKVHSNLPLISGRLQAPEVQALLRSAMQYAHERITRR